MSVQPFSVSAEAADWIAENLEKVAKALESEADGSSLVPILCFAYRYQTFDKDYATVLELYDGNHFFLGWDAAEKDPGGYHQVEIGDFNVFIQHRVLKELEGKELILETVEVGYPIPASKKCQLLRARSKSGGNPPNL